MMVDNVASELFKYNSKSMSMQFCAKEGESDAPSEEGGDSDGEMGGGKGETQRHPQERPADHSKLGGKVWSKSHRM